MFLFCFIFQQGVWETLLAALEILIRANHHQQMFNIKQLLKAQVVHHFLLTCQVLQVLSLRNPTLCLANTQFYLEVGWWRLNAIEKAALVDCPPCFQTHFIIFRRHSVNWYSSFLDALFTAEQKGQGARDSNRLVLFENLGTWLSAQSIHEWELKWAVSLFIKDLRCLVLVAVFIAEKHR